ncbi:glycosyltransferase [Paenibacillus caseinilyticus]|uniref:glycosyltransferase n=1 Tax=Paenibacillus mucilaginosus TaxID=61624 RepID=UPI000259322F|nr:glycosyltransferase [Paenibacillus mucilaginosus]
MTANRNPIRVLHLISSFEMGGAEKLLLDLLVESKNTNTADFVVVVMNDLVNEAMKKELLETGRPVYFLDRPPSHKHPKYLLQLLGIVRRHRIQLIHSHTYGSKVWAILCKAVMPRLKIAFTIHDMSVVRSLSPLHILLHRKIINRNVAISESVLVDAVQRGVDNCVRIYNGIKTSSFLQYRKQDYSRTAANSIRLVNVARITHRKKGQDLLIRAVKECKDRGLNVSCSFVGGVYDYDRESFDYLTGLVNQLGLQEEIRFLGNRQDVNRLLADYDVFVLPSRFEGLGLVVLEAMAAGVPVIASNIDGPAELVQDGVNGYLFENDNASSLADKILQAAGNPQEVERMAERALEISRNFDISVMMEAYVSLYEELVFNPRRSKQG